MSSWGIPPAAAAAFGTIAMDGDEYVRCNRCGYGGCDVRVSGCGCTLHARCLQLNPAGPLDVCPQCNKPTSGLVLFPMSFREIDEARRTAASLAKNRGKKRKGGSGSEPTEESGGYISERRTGRWTTEEMAYCDKLMACFGNGSLPVADSVKLNEFLGNMLKSKQSRLTKKMKNAKLSSKLYQRKAGCLDPVEAREASELEDCFFQSIQDLQERAEIKFHMQKEWREQFSQICAATGQPLDADAWLSSVEEMDRRASVARDAARMAKRKLMMGVALKTDSCNPDAGVFIEKTDAELRMAASGGSIDGTEDKNIEDEMLSMLAEDRASYSSLDVNGKSSLLHSAPFLAKVTTYLQRHAVPFEHVDLWVPSFVGDGTEGSSPPACRLCFAGSATAEKMIGDDGKTSRPLTGDELFNLYAFGDYSQKFSFDVGCGLPGRVYESGRPTWEQSVQNAPHKHFERCGGARQWKIKTVLGIPIASPNVGRIVVVLYSCHDRPKDEDLVTRLSEEFTRLMPSPKWKLVVDIGDVDPSAVVAPPAASASTSHQISGSNHAANEQQQQHVHSPILHDDKDAADFSLLAEASMPVAASDHMTGGKDPRLDEVISLLGEFMPSDPTSPITNYLSAFMSLRLLLLRQSRSMEDEDLVRTILDSYSSYSAGGRDRADISVMLARDFMFLQQQQQQQNLFFGLGANFMPSANNNQASANSGLSLFGLPSTSSSLQNSPALTPIPAPRTIETMSIVSNS